MTPFLTEIDPRARVRGSRDALGLVPLWGHFGRHVVGNLTTVSTSLRGFTTLLLGYLFARAAQERDGAGPEAVLPAFIKFEQLAGYCRWIVNGDGELRGIDRVKLRSGNGEPIHLSADPKHQILASQKVYGLWGLYSSPARSSGWLEPREAALTADAREIVESLYLPTIASAAGREGGAIVDLLRADRVRLHLPGRHDALARALAQVLERGVRSSEREPYRRHLVEGGPGDSTRGLQPQLAALMAERNGGDPAFDRRQLRALARTARKRGSSHEQLAERLERINRIEALLVPAASAFGFLLSRHGRRPAEIGDEIGRAWRNAFETLDTERAAELVPEIEEVYGDRPARERWLRIAEALRAADYQRLVHLLLEQNAFVMRARNAGDPWARIRSGRLDVRFREESSALVARGELASAWRSNFFLDSLKWMVVELEHRQ